ncbi:MAG: hypothetical protein ACRYF9_27925 [Janthinobacterium lividum]
MTEYHPPLWTDLWSLAGDMINCTECRAPQFMQQRQLAFIHETWCSREGMSQFPYQELLAKLREMHQEDDPTLPVLGAIWTPPKD